MNLTDLFVNEIVTFSDKAFPDDLYHQVKRCLVDYVGVTRAGAAQAGSDIARFLPEETGEYLPIGCEKTSFLRAAFVNGYHSHVLELDDGHRFAMLHLSAPIFSAMLVVAQKEKLSFQQFAKGVIVGFEVTARLAMAMQPSHKQKGYHATGTCGVCGVAMAIGAALGFTPQEMKNALSAAATSAGGLLESTEGQSQMKPYNIAIAVQNGMTAAYFGKAGFCGPADVLGGKRGFFHALSGEVSPEKLQIKETDPYCISQIYVKPYAACRHCHAPIEAALCLVQSHALAYAQIASVDVYTYKLAVLGHEHTEIISGNSAKMSIPYSVAVAFIKRDAGMEAFAKECITDPAILALCGKVTVHEDAALTAKSPAIRGARVTVTMANQERYSLDIDYAKGEPENPITDAQLKDKFVSLLRYAGKEPAEIDAIYQCISTAEDTFEHIHALC